MKYFNVYFSIPKKVNNEISPTDMDQTYKIFIQLVFFITGPFLPCSIPYDLITGHDLLTRCRKRKETVKGDMLSGGQELAPTRNRVIYSDTFTIKRTVVFDYCN